MFPFELDLLRWISENSSNLLEKIAEYITMLGEETVFIAIVAFLYFVTNKKLGQKLLYVMCGNICLNNTIKNFAKVERPFVVDPSITPARVETATGYSFPSGHTQTMAGWSTTLAAHLKKSWATIVTIILIILVALSRVYLRVHYPSDVVIGAILGVTSALVFGLVYDLKENKLIPLLITSGVYLIFAIIFLFGMDANFADFYKIFGILIGFTVAYAFEDGLVKFDNDGPLWKRIIRFIIGLGIAVGLKMGLKSLFNLFEVSLTIQTILDFVRYFLMAFIALGIYPWIFKKLKF